MSVIGAPGRRSPPLGGAASNLRALVSLSADLATPRCRSPFLTESAEARQAAASPHLRDSTHGLGPDHPRRPEALAPKHSPQNLYPEMRRPPVPEIDTDAAAMIGAVSSSHASRCSGTQQ